MQKSCWNNLGIAAVAVLALVVGAFPGLAGDGPVALQTADPSCRDNSGAVYVDCGNGTVTDNRTGLVWLADAGCLGGMPWPEAMDTVAGLSDLPVTSGAADEDCGLSDGSSPGEWRLPSIGEWETMTADAVALGCVTGETGGPAITNDAGTGCWQEGPGNSFTQVQEGFYWSATSLSGFPVNAFNMSLSDGDIFNAAKTDFDFLVWPVRGGQ